MKALYNRDGTTKGLVPDYETYCKLKLGKVDWKPLLKDKLKSVEIPYGVFEHLMDRDKEMYQSPIELIMSQQRVQLEADICRAVRAVNIYVDRYELIKALQYDRGQYEKGYMDGAKALAKQFKERLGEIGYVISVMSEDPTDMCSDDACELIDTIVREMSGEQND